MNFHGLLSMLSSILAKARYCEWDEIELKLPFEVITCLDMIETLLQSKLLSLFSSRPSQSKITGYLIYFVGCITIMGASLTRMTGTFFGTDLVYAF